MIGQPYKVVVELELPESPQNMGAGMFLVCGELRDDQGVGIERSCRSAILHYKSTLHNLIATLMYTPFLLMGSAEEKQLIGIELFSGFTEHPVSQQNVVLG
jgi:seipin